LTPFSLRKRDAMVSSLGAPVRLERAVIGSRRRFDRRQFHWIRERHVIIRRGQAGIVGGIEVHETAKAFGVLRA
jgi:hypothetical protein